MRKPATDPLAYIRSAEAADDLLDDAIESGDPKYIALAKRASAQTAARLREQEPPKDG
jgi:DNA-binding phage protein